MKRRLRENNYPSIVKIQKPSIEIQDNYKGLSLEDATNHVQSLTTSLNQLAQATSSYMPLTDKGPAEMQSYIRRIADSLDVMLMRKQLQSFGPNAHVAEKLAIDPTDSGYPTVIRDYRYLSKDKEEARSALEKIPSDEELVENVIYGAMHGVFEEQPIRLKAMKEYYQKLEELNLPENMKIHGFFQGGDNGSYDFYESVERLNTHSNLPMFYTFQFKVPKRSIGRISELKKELEGAILYGFNNVPEHELLHLAQAVDSIEGIQLGLLERYEIGPFYSHHTKNREDIQNILDAGGENTTMMMYRKQFVLRNGERKIEGTKGFFKNILTGDSTFGTFAMPYTSPLYVLLPHRLIQRIYSKELPLGERTKPIAIAKSGAIVE